MNLRLLTITIASVLLLAIAAVAVILTAAPPQPSAPELNDLRQRAIAAWSHNDTASIEAETFPATAPPLTVLDNTGEVLYSSSPRPHSELSAAQANVHALSLTLDEKHLGLLLVDSNIESLVQTQQQRALIVTVTTFAAVALILGGALLWLRVRVLNPFRRLKGFARDVADGDLDSQLPMDRRNMFGAFSESFDLMRTELRRAREAEQTARAENRETLAQIGHDIRTPVAIIATASELLELAETDPSRLTRLRSIRSRSAQIDRLLRDLINTSANDLVALTVQIQQYSSVSLAELIRDCDAEQVVDSFNIPDCVVDYDPERLRQVIDNILSNTQKFADTRVTLAAAIVVTDTGPAPKRPEPHLLRLQFTDAGPGVPAADLTAIVAQGTRGSNAIGIPGSGLGLFIAAQLLERMGGELTVENTNSPEATGFSVTLLLPLS